MTKNIIVLSLLDEYRKKIVNYIAKKTNVFELDIDDLIQYELFNADKMEEISIEYLNKQKRKVAKKACSYENVVISASIKSIASLNFDELKENSYIVGILFSKEVFLKQLKKANLTPIQKKMELASFNNNQKFISSKANIIIELNENNIYRNREVVLKTLLGE